MSKLPKLRAVRVNGTASHYSIVNDATGGLIADAYYRADQIVAACNAHDDLIAALQAFVERGAKLSGLPEQYDPWVAELIVARTTLAKVSP